MNIVRGMVNRLLGSVPINPAGSIVPARMGSYGEIYVRESHGYTSAADEGSYFTAGHPTVDTAILASASIAAYTAVSPLFIIQNNAAIGGKNIILDYIRWQTAVATAAATNWILTLVTDTIKRYASAGSTLTPRAARTDILASASIAQVYAGALVATAASSPIILFNQIVRSSIPIINESYHLKFGSSSGHGEAPLIAAVAATTALRHGFNLPPVVLAPQTSLLVHPYGASATTAAQYYLDMGWTER